MENVLFEDNHLLAVNKLPGMLCQGDKTGDEIITDVYKDYIKKKYNKPGNVFLGLTHRIDRPVSGALLLARTSKALSRLTVMFKERSLNKEYLAIVSGYTEEEALLRHWLDKDTRKNKTHVHKREGKGKKAVLKYELLRIVGRDSLVKIKLHTGRPHQIRAQMASIGHPVVGDTKYGWSGNNKSGMIALHSARLSFEHPVKKENIIIKAPSRVNEFLKNFKVNELF